MKPFDSVILCGELAGLATEIVGWIYVSPFCGVVGTFIVMMFLGMFYVEKMVFE
jgi:hypothetical protein